MSKTTAKLPLKLPHSALVSAVKDTDTQLLLKEESQLQEERQRLREELNQVRSEWSKQQQEQRPQEQKRIKEFNEKLDALHREKNTCFTALDEVRALADEAETVRSVVRSIVVELSQLNREISDAEMLLRDERRELERLQQLERHPSGTAIDAQREKVKKYEDTLAAKQKLLAEKETEVTAARADLQRVQGDLTPKQIHERLIELRNQKNSIQAKINAVRKEQRSTRDGDTEPSSEGRQQERNLRSDLEAVEERLTEIREKELTYLPFQYEEGMKRELIGRGGEVLRQLQYDFGVAICIDGVVNAGEGFIIGGKTECRQCLEAMETILSHAKATSEQRVVSFDPALKRSIIGTKGSHVNQLETESGARVEVKDKEVVFTGTKEAVETGEQLLRDFLDSHSSDSLSILPKQINAVLGRGGSTIRQVESSSGVRSIRVDRERNKIVVTGSKKAVEEALRQYREILGASAGGTCVIHGDNAMIRAVVGPKGSTVRQMEKDTGARISCEDLVITITGSPEAVEEAKRLVEACRRSEKRVPVDPVLLNFMTADVVLVSEDSEEKISPLEAIRVSTKCHQLAPLWSEGCVVVRGGLKNVTEAVNLLNQLVLRNNPYKFLVKYPAVLRGVLLRRREDDADGVSLLQRVQNNFSRLLRLDIDRDAHTVVVSSVDKEEAKEAADQLAGEIKALSDTHVRILDRVPSHKVGLLVGHRGETIQGLQQTTGTEITVNRELEQVQIYHHDGDEEALQEAVEAVKEVLNMKEDEEAERR